jgi:TatD DNase family protein
MWVDTHCHLDAQEFNDQALAIRALAATERVAKCVYPAVEVANFKAVQALAHATGDAYALGIHPLYVPQAKEEDLQMLDAQLQASANDPQLVAVGEIGLDFFVPALCTPAMRERQTFFYHQQLRLARKHQLPVILHVRRSADQLLAGLRRFEVRGGIAHAFNGSLQQAHAFIDLGFKLGFGGAMTYERALQLRRLATELPLDALVLETDAPDMPPKWLYVTAEQRAQGQAQARNDPTQLPAIAQVLADLRGISLQELAMATTHNASQALPRLFTTPIYVPNQTCRPA